MSQKSFPLSTDIELHLVDDNPKRVKLFELLIESIDNLTNVDPYTAMLNAVTLILAWQRIKVDHGDDHWNRWSVWMMTDADISEVEHVGQLLSRSSRRE